MKERESKLTEVDEGEFYEKMLTLRANILSQAGLGDIPVNIAQLQVNGIESILNDIEKALDHGLRVRFYKDEKGSFSLKYENKGRCGFIK